MIALKKILKKINSSLVICTYNSDSIIIYEPENYSEKGNSIIVNKPMSIDICEDVLYIASKYEVTKYTKFKKVTNTNTFLPIQTFHTGEIDWHDLRIGSKDIFLINSSNSSICKLDVNFSFNPIWRPPFIDSFVFEDRCHLNGLALKNGVPNVVTTLGTSNLNQSWRTNVINGGTLIDINRNEVILSKLPMPHSPVFFENRLYLLLSATGEFVKIDKKNKKIEVIASLNGFCRGLVIYKGYAFIGLSKLRKNSSTVQKLSYPKEQTKAELVVVNIMDKEIINRTKIDSIEEIYDIKLFKEQSNANILSTSKKEYLNGLILPNNEYWSN